MTDQLHIINETFAEYHGKRDRYLSSHMLATFRRCPWHYEQKLAGAFPDKDTPAYQFGRAWHCLVFEGAGRFEEVYRSDSPVNEKTGKPFGVGTKAYDAWADEVRGNGGEIITADQSLKLGYMASRVYAAGMGVYLGQGEPMMPEAVVRADYLGEPCQIRMDAFLPDLRLLLDGKTCDNLDYFEHDFRRFGYAYQLAFYQAVLECAGGPVRCPVKVLAQEKSEPYRVGLWNVPQAILDLARRENADAINRLQECRRTGDFPTGYELERTIDSF